MSDIIAGLTMVFSVIVLSGAFTLSFCFVMLMLEEFGKPRNNPNPTQPKDEK